MSSTDLLCLEEDSTRYHEPSFLSRNKIKTATKKKKKGNQNKIKRKTGQAEKEHPACVSVPSRADTQAQGTGALPPRQRPRRGSGSLAPRGT